MSNFAIGDIVIYDYPPMYVNKVGTIVEFFGLANACFVVNQDNIRHFVYLSGIKRHLTDIEKLTYLVTGNIKA